MPFVPPCSPCPLLSVLLVATFVAQDRPPVDPKATRAADLWNW
ncbi:MAG: hypothetical protein R2712_09870 [Vicinamibacterales bacterium]